jgi:hypothetical protein
MRALKIKFISGREITTNKTWNELLGEGNNLFGTITIDNTDYFIESIESVEKIEVSEAMATVLWPKT